METLKRWLPGLRAGALVWAMAMLLAGRGLGGLAGFAHPLGMQPPSRLVFGTAAGCVLAALLLLRLGPRLPGWSWAALTLATIVPSTLLVAVSQRGTVAVLAGLGYSWTCLYAALFLSRRFTHICAALCVLGDAVGLRADRLPSMGIAWVVTTLTVLGLTAVTCSLVAQLRRLSESDPLTGLVNRAGLARAAGRELANARRYGRPLAMAVLDLNDLKAVNDSGGHAAGDELLRLAAMRWTAALRGGDVLARIGGDEFALLLPDTDEPGAQVVLRRLRTAGEARFAAGVAMLSPEDDLAGLLSRADRAMYQRKRRMRRTPGDRPPAPRLVPVGS